MKEKRRREKEERGSMQRAIRWIFFIFAGFISDGHALNSNTVHKILDTDAKLDSFKLMDSMGFGMTITVLGVVVVGLIVLYLLFKLVGYIAICLSHKRAMKLSGMTKEEAKGITERSGDIFAAIALAIYEATELHDEENTILTIKNTARNYSPWSSKIYTLRETPNKK